MGKHYCICENKCLKETYSKSEFDNKTTQQEAIMTCSKGWTGVSTRRDCYFTGTIIGVEAFILSDTGQYVATDPNYIDIGYYGVNGFTTAYLRAGNEGDVNENGQIRNSIFYNVSLLNGKTAPNAFTVKVRVTLLNTKALFD